MRLLHPRPLMTENAKSLAFAKKANSKVRRRRPPLTGNAVVHRPRLYQRLLQQQPLCQRLQRLQGPHSRTRQASSVSKAGSRAQFLIIRCRSTIFSACSRIYQTPTGVQNSAAIAALFPTIRLHKCAESAPKQTRTPASGLRVKALNTSSKSTCGYEKPTWTLTV